MAKKCAKFKIIIKLLLQPIGAVVVIEKTLEYKRVSERAGEREKERGETRERLSE